MYPVINAAAINGAEQATSRGIQSTRFGRPYLQTVWAAQSLPAGVFGVPRLKVGTDVELYPFSLQPVRFGPATVLRGLAPGYTALEASGLRPTRFGTPSAALSGPAVLAAAWRPTHFGVAAASFSHTAAGLRPAHFGVPVLGGSVFARSVQPVAFGSATTVHRLAAKSISARGLGVPGAHQGALECVASSLDSPSFGTPGLGGYRLSARTFFPWRFGVPTLDRGQTC